MVTKKTQKRELYAPALVTLPNFFYVFSHYARGAFWYEHKLKGARDGVRNHA